MALFRKRPPAVPAPRVWLDPAAGLPAARAAYDALKGGDWWAIEEAHGRSRDWETLGAISNALAKLHRQSQTYALLEALTVSRCHLIMQQTR